MGTEVSQATAQKLSTIIWQQANGTIFIISNGGYAYERPIRGMYAAYNDIAPWYHLDAPRLFSAPDGYPIETHRIQTGEGLDKLLAPI